MTVEVVGEIQYGILNTCVCFVCELTWFKKCLQTGKICFNTSFLGISLVLKLRQWVEDRSFCLMVLDFGTELILDVFQIVGI